MNTVLRRLFAGAIVLFSLSLFSEAFAQETQSGHLVIRDSRAGEARLIINRTPNLGNGVIVDLWIDGIPAGPIGYGHSYESYLSPGQHILSTLASPKRLWPNRSNLTLRVRSGETYFFIATSDHSGHLVLKGGNVFAMVR